MSIVKKLSIPLSRSYLKWFRLINYYSPTILIIISFVKPYGGFLGSIVYAEFLNFEGQMENSISHSPRQKNSPTKI